MRLKIKTGKLSLNFWLPLSAVKSKLTYKMLVKAHKKSAENQEAKELTPEEENQTEQSLVVAAPKVLPSHQQLKEAYETLKKFVKENGHFTLVDICAEGEMKIKIVI